MKPRITRTLAMCFAWLLAANWLALNQPVVAQETDGIHFHTDYNEALREARKTRKPIFLEFRCAP